MNISKSFFEKLKVPSGQIALTFGGMIFLQLATFLGLILMSRNFSNADVGKYQLLFSVVMMLSLVAKLGLDEGISYYLPKYTKAKPHQILPIIGYSLLVTLVLSTFLGGLVSVFAGPINSAVFKMSGFEVELQSVFYVLPGFAFLMVSLAALRGIERSDIRAYIYYFGMSGFFLTGLILLSLCSFNLESVISLRTGVFFVGGAVSLIFVCVQSGRLLELPSKETLKDLQRFSGTVILISFMQYIVEQPLIDLALVSRIGTPDEVGRYAIASRVGALVAVGFNAMTIVVGPRISSAVHHGDLEQVKVIYKRTRKWLLGVSLVMATALIICSGWILSIFGEEYVKAKPVLVIFAIGYCLLALGGLNLAFMLAYRLQKQELALELGAVVLMVVSGVILGKYLGPPGVAAATVLSLVLLNFGRLFFLRKLPGKPN